MFHEGWEEINLQVDERRGFSLYISLLVGLGWAMTRAMRTTFWIGCRTPMLMCSYVKDFVEESKSSSNMADWFLSFHFKSWWTSFHSLVSICILYDYLYVFCTGMQESLSRPPRCQHHPFALCMMSSWPRNWDLFRWFQGPRGWHGLLGRQRLTATVVVLLCSFTK